MTSEELIAELTRLGSATVYEASGRQGLVDADFRQLIPGSGGGGGGGGGGWGVGGGNAGGRGRRGLW
jgi:hypothetical protein